MKNGICPYPGLRPFTEEESIFFKGRDTHISQIAKLLEENKMAFITGASGDGKSSMVYAGVIPYIRAGFSKAQFNSWLIFDFKPQRNTLKSLAESAAKELEMPLEEVVTEFRRGFSSLVKLYTKSKFYVTGVEDAENKGKNLLIIADQFEEVFTMNDNFLNGVPSNDSYTAINLLLETVRISIKRNLPVYVIFTMRSDFISQCTVFKDLPEFIAYSQFFVPQLKRSEIRQVIEEPALLAGGKISPRLTEVIINNLNSGFDQLPVLQHALNLLWKTADGGNEELDLIHLAKIAGISKDVLSEEERRDFDNWFSELPAYRKKYFEKPDLNNVLNAHAGTLYESSYDYFLKNANWAEKNITPEESKQIIETAFKCLTKIDNNRQVRNRSSLNEITGIINNPKITTATVCGVLNIFRSEDNTLMRPFALDGSLETQYLSGDTVLDVTHEALIRNWKMLSEWDEEELENLKEYNDFNTQMQRWLDNGRNEEFLLTSGNYAFFNNWYQKCRPNPYWILKHDNSQRPEREKLRSAANRFEKCEAYIKQSREALIAKEKARKKKVVITLAGLIIFIAGLSIFSYWAMQEKKNADRQTVIAEENAARAEENAKKAEQQTSAALEAKQEAQEQRDNADRMYHQALEAKKESDLARYQAELSRQDAEESKLKAEKNFILAEEQRQTAEKERQNALYQMELTKQANDSASRLYYVALCNALSMKAKNQYEDKKLNLRLAKTACEMNSRSGNNQNKAELYDAMLFALEENNYLKPLTLSNGDLVKNFTLDGDGNIYAVGEDATISKYIILNGGSVKKVSETTDFQSKVPVEKAFFLDFNNVVISAKDKSAYLVNIISKVKTKLPLHNSYIRSVIPISDDSYCLVAAYVNGFVDVEPWSKGAAPRVSKDFQKQITDVYFQGGGAVYVLFHDGNLKKWDYKNDKIEDILQPSTSQNAFKLSAVPDKNMLLVCFSDGNMQFLDLTSGKITGSMAVGHSKLENMLYDSNTGILALASADKRISLINTNDFQAKPLVIEEHSLGNSKVKAMSFNNKGVLFVLTDDNKLRFWDTDVNTYANTLSAMKLAPLSNTEWNWILGSNFSEK